MQTTLIAISREETPVGGRSYVNVSGAARSTDDAEACKRRRTKW
jgi:hypothetical protein